MSSELSIDLFSFASDEIKISIVARFEAEALIIDGYDIGPRVKEYWGDSDYEYVTTIPPESVCKLYNLLEVKKNDKTSLLDEMAKRFNTNSCYSDIQKFLDQHKITYESFSWT